MSAQTPFYLFLTESLRKGGFSNEEVVALILPLLEKVNHLHDNGLVAPLQKLESILVVDGKLDLDETQSIAPVLQPEAIEKIYRDNQLPVYLPHWRSYELELGHHDAATDIFVLGMIMASLSLHLDFTQPEALETFVQNRPGMLFAYAHVHPAIANVIAGMTELNRRKRWTDLQEVIDHLKNYRGYQPEKEMDLAQVVSLQQHTPQNREQVIQSKLRNRLFDTSRRNRLLYFKPNLKFVQLTVSSVPPVLDQGQIDVQKIFCWNQELAKKIGTGKNISLSSHLLFDEHLYLAPALDRIRQEANRNVNEYGFNQLRLAICFLHWYHIKEQETEKTSSPLLLVPVTLVKKKGVKDQFVLEINETEAEINPVLAHLLKEQYGIRLPESIALDESGPAELFQDLKKQVEKSGSGIVLDYTGEPPVEKLHHLSRQTIAQYLRRTDRQQKKTVPVSNAVPVLPTKAGDEGPVNFFRWEMDVCSLVLGNFNYKKMSLVRDYNTILEENIKSPVFDALFSEQAKQPGENTNRDHRIEDQYTIVQADATQLRAVQFARNQSSYIIQGPPGTGKSQTITNLVADYVARGKKVLFVCEKRAAIDVVYHRLQQQGLDELCCLIHDSQSDKKAFIQNLKGTYEKYLEKGPALTEIEAERNVLVARINAELKVLRDFHGMMNQGLETSKIKVHELLEILVSSKNDLAAFKAFKAEVPGYEQWTKYGETLQRLSSTTQAYTGQPYFSQHPFRQVSERVFSNDLSAQAFKENLARAQQLIAEIIQRLSIPVVPAAYLADLEKLKIFLEQVELLVPFKENDHLGLLEQKSELLKTFNQCLKKLQLLENALEETRQKNEYWTNKFSKTDTENALAILQKNEGAFFSFLNSAYRKTKKAVRQAYDLNRHQVKPPFTQIVGNLKAEYAAEDQLKNEQAAAADLFGPGDLYALQENLQKVRETLDTQVLQLMKNKALDETTLAEIRSVGKLFEQLYFLLQDHLKINQPAGFPEIEKMLAEVLERAGEVQAFAPLLKELRFAHDALKKLVNSFELAPGKIQSLLAWSSLDGFYARNKHLEKLEGIGLLHHIESIKKIYRDLLAANARYVCAKQQQALLELLARAERPMAGKSEREKEEKRALNEGRKVLENEFGKTMRYKSIRELATGEPGQIIRELKPVWLMSPLSVSDTLPLQADYFDVVIFDEASQITLEEGVPPVYRAPQTIVVGDEMQMPPSHFFSSSGYDPDDLFDEEDEPSEPVSLDADSLLAQGARKFPSVMLGWHYRSRHESLISFSNASFYQHQLLTIPDPIDQQRTLSPIIANKKEDARRNLDLLLERPISYHYLEHGVYEKRRNLAEAEYIAELVRNLLLRETGLSLGVVAFSMEQQAEIEGAIERLAQTDEAFDKLLEEEYRRMDDDQFNGIFFKNLENVQGDERELIIMSTCYGYDANKKMRMNFGPINRRGGEKRLNVIFSRAKKHMCVVSSIRFGDITNTYNEGASYFRKYLQYAALASEGKMDLANQVLKNIQAPAAEKTTDQHVVTEQLKAALEEKGWVVQTGIGQSYFKCHLGIKRNVQELQYLAGILVDDAAHYANADVMEQYVFKPEILRTCGWKIVQVYTRDWFEDREKVLKRVMAVFG